MYDFLLRIQKKKNDFAVIVWVKAFIFYICTSRTKVRGIVFVLGRRGRQFFSRILHLVNYIRNVTAVEDVPSNLSLRCLSYYQLLTQQSFVSCTC